MQLTIIGAEVSHRAKYSLQPVRFRAESQKSKRYWQLFATETELGSILGGSLEATLPSLLNHLSAIEVGIESAAPKSNTQSRDRHS
jgi:hypothetical protein